MKTMSFVAVIAVVVAAQAGMDARALAAREFADPSAEYGVNCWWWWLNGNTDKAAISRELSAMKEMKFQGAMVLDAGGYSQGGHANIPAGPTYGSDEWCALFAHALDEAARLGLEIGFNIQSGWNVGGPCVTPQYAAKKLTSSHIDVEGGKGGAKLPMPRTRNGFYRDIAVLAFPLDDANALKEGVKHLDLKLGAKEVGMSAADCRFLLGDGKPGVRDASSNTGKAAAWDVRLGDIVNLTRKMRSDGRLDWTPPAGRRWRVVRVGYTCSGSKVSTSSGAWQGLTLDYLSRDAFEFYWNAVVEPIFARIDSRHIGRTLKYMETDSWECGGMNWTDGFEREFKSVMGYDPVPYLAVLGGAVVDGMAATDAFLADFRKAVAGAIFRNHYKRFAEKAHARGMGVQPECSGPHAGPFDGIRNYSASDIVMSEFWSPSPHRPNPPQRFFVKQASSAAHIFGKRIVGAESFTTIGPQWNDLLWKSQKSAFDHEVCSGLNRVYFHTFTSSPASMGTPGQEYFAGTHVNPRVTWWKDGARSFIDYLRRVQSVAQRATVVSDVLYYYGDHVPNILPLKEADFARVLPGYDFDAADESALLSLKVDRQQGHLYMPSGATYRVLVLPDHKVLSLAALRKVAALAEAGAAIIGEKPERCVSLVGGDAAQKEFKALAGRLWDGAGGRKPLIAFGVSVREFLQKVIDVRQDFTVASGAKPSEIDYIHLSLNGIWAYFVSNQTAEPRSVVCEFRVSGAAPEIWDPLTGRIRPLPAYSCKDSTTSVPLSFEPYGAYFVVFSLVDDTDGHGRGGRNFPEYKPIATLEGEWRVAFDTAWGGPGKVVFPSLMDWTQSNDPGVRFYSGAATYRKTFNFAGDAGGRLHLELGEVLDVGVARVTLNGRDLGVAWTKPFRVDATGVLRKGENVLEVKVVNSWHNRVFGDQFMDGGRKFTQTNIRIGKRKGSKPSPSGLIGPVRIVAER